MKLRELRPGNESAWITPTKQYWQNEIHNKCVEEEWTNEEQMQQDAETYINNLQNTYITYKEGTSKESLEKVLLPIYVYLSIKYGMTVSGDPPSIPEIIENEDIRNCYINWTLDIPNGQDLFTLEEGEEPFTGKVVLTEIYNNFKSAIEGGNDTDSTKLEAVECTTANSIRPLMLYQLYGKPNTTPANINHKEYVLNDMHLQEILDEFGFEIKGINS